jgi:hypothetical protein
MMEKRIIILLVLLLTMAGVERSASAFHSKSPFDPMSISHRLSRTELLHALGDSVVIYDSMLHVTKGVESRVLLVGTVNLLGISSLAQVTLVRDSLEHAEFYLPYRARRGSPPMMPCQTSGAIKGSIADLETIRTKLGVQGEASVTGEAFFVYLSSAHSPYIAANYREGVVTVSVTPPSDRTIR